MNETSSPKRATYDKIGPDCQAGICKIPVTTTLQRAGASAWTASPYLLGSVSAPYTAAWLLYSSV
jgi:hypothetical protein